MFTSTWSFIIFLAWLNKNPHPKSHRLLRVPPKRQHETSTGECNLVDPEQLEEQRDIDVQLNITKPIPLSSKDILHFFQQFFLNFIYIIVHSHLSNHKRKELAFLKLFMIRETILPLKEVLNNYNCHSTFICIEFTSVIGIHFAQYWIHCHFHMSVQKKAVRV